MTWVVFMVNAERRSLLADEITDYLDLDTPAWCMWMMGFFYSWNMYDDRVHKMFSQKSLIIDLVS